MFRVELMKAWRRWRTYLLAAALGGIPVLIVIAVKLSPPTPAATEDAPPFLFQILRNGLFAPLTGLAVIQPFFLPLAAGLLAGDSVAGEAQAGTLRYLLVRPVARTRLVLGKYGAAMLLLGIASEVADQIPSLRVIHPFLPTHGWLSFTDLFRFPVEWSGMRGGVLVSAVYTAVFLTLGLEPGDHVGVLGLTSLALVQPTGLEQLGVVDPGDRLGDEVTEVGILCPGDRALGDCPHHGR